MFWSQKNFMNARRSLFCGAFMLAPLWAYAGEVTIISAEAEKSADNAYRFSVTLKHDDEGWDHYADEWRILLKDGTVLGTRTLAHPHVKEQPFTRGLGNVVIPEGVKSVMVDARDSVHGRSSVLLEVILPE